jgi:SH3 domain protein
LKGDRRVAHKYDVGIEHAARLSVFADKFWRRTMSCWCGIGACLIVGNIDLGRFESMNKRKVLQISCLLGCGLLAAVPAFGEQVWVSDQFEIMLRTGASTSNAIQRMLTSGTQLEAIEQDTEAGYTRVRTAGGTEGWVLTRYLMSEPPARVQLESLTAQLTNANSRGTSMGSQLDAIKGEYDGATRQIRALENEQQRLESELAEIKRSASNVLVIDSRNKELQQQLTDAEIKVSILEQENQELNSQQLRYWFLSGALVLLIGVILGIWLPRVRWQRRSRYDSF